MKLTYIMGISCTMMRLFFHKLSITNTLFLLLQQILYAGHIVTLFSSVGALHVCYGSAAATEGPTVPNADNGCRYWVVAAGKPTYYERNLIQCYYVKYKSDTDCHGTEPVPVPKCCCLTTSAVTGKLI